MYGVCWVHTDFGGGGGSYVGGVCRTTRRWWDGYGWVETPVSEGPFPSREHAQQFVDKTPMTRYHRLFVYVKGDPFGEIPSKEDE